MDKPRWHQLSLRTLLEIVALVAVVLAFVYHWSGTKGRFQMMNTPRGSGSEVFLYDTATGRVWQQEYDGSWTEAALPGLKR
jgi:hypothetical protein